MIFHKYFVTTKTFFDFSNKGLKQFMYGNTFAVLDALFNLLIYVTSSFFRVNSDKETSLVVVQEHNPIKKQGDDSSMVSISNKRCSFLSSKSITGFVEEPKAVCFIFLEKKMVTFSNESKTTSIVLEKPFIVEKSQSEEMLVYEFMSCGVLKELLVQENFVGVEENLFDDDDDDDGFIELSPSFQISNIAYEEEEEEEYDSDSDDEFEHSDVIERLKTELRSARTGGLCTILEESETTLEELKPLKIEPKPDQLKDKISEIQKVYKNYAVRMRKLDVIDSQTMHSISKSQHKYQSLLNCYILLYIHFHHFNLSTAGW